MFIARIPETLSDNPLLSAIAINRSSRRYSVLMQCWSMQVFAALPTPVGLFVGIHWRSLLMNSFLLLRQCTAYDVRFTWRGKASGSIVPILWVAASGVCWKQRKAFLCCYQLAFSLESDCTILLAWLQLGRIPLLFHPRYISILSITCQQ